jgi:5-methyltetrahydrofolate--homocysteine methyltransferase
MSRFGEALRSGRVLLMDGATGTELQRAGIRTAECYELWNLTHPERVRAIHQAYADAGADVLLTNTFQANPGALRRHGLEQRLEEISRAAVELARAVAGPRFVVVSVGPAGPASDPLAGWGSDDLRRFLPAVAGADALVLETFSNRQAPALVRFVRDSGLLPRDYPLLLSLTYERGATGLPRTHDGGSAEVLAAAAREAGVTALGVNCGRDMDPDGILEVIRGYRQATDLPLFARPNAGTPSSTKGRQAGSTEDGQDGPDGEHLVYPHTPARMAAGLPALLAAGVGMVGGCCGTTPEHIAAFRTVVAAWNAAHSATAS